MKDKNKYLTYGRHWIENRDIQAVAKVLRGDWITQGPSIESFEKKLSKQCNARFAVVLSSGTAALHLACLAAGIENGDEVITSPITFVASANCVLYCGGRPVFADIQEDTVNIDPVELRKKITNKTKTVIPVHFAGHPCDLEEINRIAKKHNLVVIEDACHALGAEYKGTKIGSCRYSDMTVFSFHPVKSITTGEGGAVLTNNKKLYERLLMFRSHGIVKERAKLINKNEGPWFYEMQELGYNYRITDFQCALGISQLKRLNEFIKRRREIAEIYIQELSKIKEIILPVERPYVKSSWHLYAIRIKAKKSVVKREALFSYLSDRGIYAQVHYIPVHLQPYYKKMFGYKEGAYPKAEEYYRGAITLPLYPRMVSRDIKYVVKIISKLF